MLKKFLKVLLLLEPMENQQLVKYYLIFKKNKYKSLLGGNIGTPILNLNIEKNNFLIIEASSFQLAHSKFIVQIMLYY